jgi:hypothetical protein
MKKLSFLSILLTLFLFGCTSQIPQQTQTIAENDSAKIVITRDSRLWGAAFSAPIYINQVYIGKVGNGGTLQWNVKPGPVTVSTSEGIAVIEIQHAKNAISINAVRNNTYTFKLIAPYQMSFIAPSFGLQLINPT